MKISVAAVTWALTGKYCSGMRVRITNADRTKLYGRNGYTGTLLCNDPLCFSTNELPARDQPLWWVEIDNYPHDKTVSNPPYRFWIYEDCMEPLWEEDNNASTK